ncbi:expressed unknown protein [Seminavis robusta]|uniref:Uncharacterized protein n=1 Tax=Seminavis robusta TaxID=568900 RepID=A0A9N8DEI1_9STRA|nr:expressed unknown protein [Seminavis robusta]|eukprot:Sro57_g033280.1 n/a (486) ;mRNA; r:61837-63378
MRGLGRASKMNVKVFTLWAMLVCSIIMLWVESDLVSRLEGGDMMSMADYHHRRRGLKSRKEYIPFEKIQALQQEAQRRNQQFALTDAIRSVTSDADFQAKMERKKKVREKIHKRKTQKEDTDYRHYVEGMELSKSFEFNKTDFSNYSVLPSHRHLPDMTAQKGGVIFFLHTPKTGGQTIRYSFGGPPDPSTTFIMDSAEQLKLARFKSRVRFIMANRLNVFLERVVPKINRYLTAPTTKRKILFVEVHGMDNYHTRELEPYLHAWRERAQETKVPFFTFTIMREALAEQVSFFNFYFIHPGDERFCKGTMTTSTRCNKRNAAFLAPYLQLTPEQLEETHIRETTKKNKGIDLEDAMMKSIYDNPQCLFLARGERTFGWNVTELRHGLTFTECESSYQSLRRTMDWIGRTDTLTNETLPLLTKMIFNDSTIGWNFKQHNKSPERGGFVSLSKIQPSTREFLVESSRLDDFLYRQVVQDYHMDQWVV